VVKTNENYYLYLSFIGMYIFALVDYTFGLNVFLVKL